MIRLIIVFAVSGGLFALGPLFVNRSGLDGVSASLVAATASFFFVGVFSLYSGISVASSKWWLVVIAVGFGTIGILLYNNDITKVPPGLVGQLATTAVIAQLIVWGVYDAYINGLTLAKMLGFASAILTAVLLAPQSGNH